MKEYEVTSKEDTELIEHKEAEQVLYHHRAWFQWQSGEARTVVIVNNFPAPAHGMQNWSLCFFQSCNHMGLSK